MTQEPEPTGDRLARLTELAEEILSEAEKFGKDSGRQFVSLARRARANRRLIWLTVIGLILDVTLTIGFGWALNGLNSNTNRIDSLTHRLDVAQSDTRAKAWCPLYQLFLESESPEARKAAADPKAYDHAFKVIKDGYDALNCDEFRNAPPAFTPSPKG